MNSIKIKLAMNSLPDPKPEKVQEAFQQFLQIPSAMINLLDNPNASNENCAGCTECIEQLRPKGEELKQKREQLKSIFNTHLFPALEEITNISLEVNESIRKRKCTRDSEAGGEEEDENTITINSSADLLAVMLASQLAKRVKKEKN